MVGVNSAALYVAHLIRERLPEPPALQTVAMSAKNDFSLFLELVIERLKRSTRGIRTEDINEAAKPWEDKIRDEKASPARDNHRIEEYLYNMLGDLKDLFASAPWLILIVDKIDNNQKSWIPKSENIFRDAKILPIYLTNSLGALTNFQNLVQGLFDGLAVPLAKIDAGSADRFARRRLDRYRKGTAPTEHFPFTPDAISTLVSKESDSVIPIKFLIPRLVDAFDMKLKEISDNEELEPKDILIDYEYIRKLFKRELGSK
jgi:hypothetical protein